MSRRQKARQMREAAHWAAKQAAAGDPATRAAVAFDRLRARLADLPVDDRDIAWQRVTAELEALADHYAIGYAA